MSAAQGIALIIVIALIIAVGWWFLGKHDAKSEGSKVKSGRQTATITVKGGYSPQRVVLKKGIPATVNFNMQDNTACLSHVVFSDLGINKDLTKQPVTKIDIPTDKAKTFNFACGMDMFHGQVVVK